MIEGVDTVYTGRAKDERIRCRNRIFSVYKRDIIYFFERNISKN